MKSRRSSPVCKTTSPATGVSALEEIGGMLDKFNDLALDDDDDEDDDDEMLYDIQA
jgi:hypothetical protein